jgi:hypothetical protein
MTKRTVLFVPMLSSRVMYGRVLQVPCEHKHDGLLFKTLIQLIFSFYALRTGLMSGKIDYITINSPMVDVNVRKHFDVLHREPVSLFQVDVIENTPGTFASCRGDGDRKQKFCDLLQQRKLLLALRVPIIAWARFGILLPQSLTSSSLSTFEGENLSSQFGDSTSWRQYSASLSHFTHLVIDTIVIRTEKRVKIH